MSDKYKGWYIVNFDPLQPESATNHRLSDEEKEHNAVIAMRMLRSNKFSKYAAAGMVGNMWAESFMSPAQWENPTGPDTGLLNRGYGLVQWTPATLYIDWAEATGHADDWNGNGTLEIKRIFYEREQHIEFFAPPESPYQEYGWTAYSEIEPESGESDDDCVNRAAAIFVWNYLRPGPDAIAATLDNRQYHSRYVFDNCPGDPVPPWLLMKMAKINQKLRG